MPPTMLWPLQEGEEGHRFSLLLASTPSQRVEEAAAVAIHSTGTLVATAEDAGADCLDAILAALALLGLAEVGGHKQVAELASQILQATLGTLGLEVLARSILVAMVWLFKDREEEEAITAERGAEVLIGW